MFLENVHNFIRTASYSYNADKKYRAHDATKEESYGLETKIQHKPKSAGK